MPVFNKKKKLIPKSEALITDSPALKTNVITQWDIPWVTWKAKPLQKAIDSSVKETWYKADPAFWGVKKPLQELWDQKTTITQEDSKKFTQEMDDWTRDETWQIIKPEETDVLKWKLTDVEFNKQKAEQDKLLEEEKTAAKKIWFSELWYKKEKDWLTTLQERWEADLKDTFDDAIIKAEIDHKNTQHNVNMARSGLWMPESKAETEWFNTVVSESKRSLDRLKSLSSTRKTRLEENFAKQFDTLNTSRKKAFDENMRKLLDEMSISDLEWTLDTKSWLADLRTKLQDVLYSDEELAMANIQRYQFGINQLNKQIDELEEYESNAKTIDESTSKMKWYYTNMNWDPFLDDSWNFIDIPDNSKIVYTSEPDVNGKVKMFSRSSDWTIKMNTLNTWIGSAEAPKVQKIWTDNFGNDIYGTYNASTKQFDPIKIWGTPSSTTQKDFTWDFSTLDFSTNTDLINKYTWEASFKNNNPTWITFWASPELENLWKEAWVNFWKWTDRPESEWWNYYKFNSVQDWLDAYTISLTQAWSDNVYDRLVKWVWTDEWDSYATWLMSQAWINKWDKFSELDENQLWLLMSAQLQKESPNYYNELATLSQEPEEESAEITPRDIMTFNSSTFKPQSDIKSASQQAKYDEFLKQKDWIMWEKEASMEDILKYSAWWKDLTDTSIKSLTKFDQALSQLWEIQWQISDLKTWPILWRLKGMNPYDTDVRTLKASLTALLPTLARWVYGEVWVLTDNDIRLYSQTIPNLTDTKQTNEAILAMTLKVVAWGYKKQLQTLAAAWKDVSWFSWLYDNLMSQVETLESNLPAPWDVEEKEWSSIKDLTNKYFWEDKKDKKFSLWKLVSAWSSFFRDDEKDIKEEEKVEKTKEEKEEDLYKKYYK